MAAGEAVWEAAGALARVAVYEASDRVGRSILATGNGRCNFSNAQPDAALYRNGAFVGEALAALEEAFGRESAFSGVSAPGAAPGAGAVAEDSSSGAAAPGASNAVLRFFSDHGLVWREESEGRLYPLANKATSVLDCLRAAGAAAGVEERVECEVAAAEPPRKAGGRFTLRLADGRFERADAVVVAAGGTVARALLPEGVPFRTPEPTLGPLATDPRWPRRLDNIRVRGALELWRGGRCAAREAAEVMFRKYGVSGIAAFNLSRLAHPGDELAVDFLPMVPPDGAEAFLAARRVQLEASCGRAVTWDDMLRGMVLAPVADVLLDAARLAGADLVRDGGLGALARVLKGLRLPVTGLGDPRQCQVHRGGVEVCAVSPRTCELRNVPGLHIVGEALDVDAPCGGYNLHWAWASGLLAGRAAAEGVRV